MKLTNEDVQEILRLLDATKYDELCIETERFKLTLRRDGASGWTQKMKVTSPPNLIAGAPSVPPVAGTGVASGRDANSGSGQTEGLVDVRAHLPGTFYLAPTPGAAPFVEAGSRVEKNAVVAILETMKLMNAVHATARGEIAEICFQNAQFVEKGAILMRIRPVAK